MTDWSEKQQAEINRQLDNALSMDQYNTTEPRIDEFDVRNIFQLSQKWAPKKGEKIIDYLPKLKIYTETAIEFSRKTHINGPKGAWYSHRNPMGCFACGLSDILLTSYHIISYISSKDKDLTF